MAKTWWAGGPYFDTTPIAQYERQFAARCDAKHGISFGSGRMALYAILEALGVGPGDEVIIPAFTCAVVPNAIIYRGARPIYVDIEPISFNIDVAKIEDAISSKCKALYAQHTFGVACNITALREIARRHHLPIIEDAAHALGMVFQGETAGSLTEVAFFSTDHSKMIGTHLGGMAVTNDDILASRIRKIQQESPHLEQADISRIIRSFLVEFICFAPAIYWIGRSILSMLTHCGFLFYFRDVLKIERPATYPYPCRLSSAQARLGLSQLAGLADNLEHRRRIAEWLESKIGWYGISTMNIAKSAWLRYSFLVRDRAAFEATLSRRFDLGIWFTSVVAGRLHEFEAVGYLPGSCPIAEFVAKHIVNLPTHPHIPLAIIQKELTRQWDRIANNILPITERQRQPPSLPNVPWQ